MIDRHLLALAAGTAVAIATLLAMRSFTRPDPIAEEHRARVELLRRERVDVERWTSMRETADELIASGRAETLPLAHLTRAYAHANLLRFDEAMEDFRAAKRVDARYANHMNGPLLAQLFAGKGEHARAREIFEDLLTTNPRGRNVLQTFGIYLLSLPDPTAKDLARGRELLGRTIPNDPAKAISELDMFTAALTAKGAWREAAAFRERADALRKRAPIVP